jgi:hypothetical protein
MLLTIGLRPQPCGSGPHSQAGILCLAHRNGGLEKPHTQDRRYTSTKGADALMHGR